MAWVLYDAEGRPVEVADEEVADRVQRGELFFKDDQSVPVTSPDGKVGTVPARNASLAFTKKFTFTPEAVAQKKVGESGTEQLKALAEGAAGIIPGAPAVEAALFENKKEQQRRAEAFPGTKVLGEVGGAIAATALSGGGAAPATGRSLLARVGAVAAREAAISGTLGGSVEINRQILGDEELSAQKVLAASGTSALWGAGVGGTFETASALASGVIGKGLKSFGPKTAGPKRAAGDIAGAVDAITAKVETDPTSMLGRLRNAVVGKDESAAAGRLARDPSYRALGRTAASDADRIANESAAGFESMRGEMDTALTAISTRKKNEIAAALADIDPVAPRVDAFRKFYEPLRDRLRFMREGDGAGRGGLARYFDAPQISQMEAQLARLEDVLGIVDEPTGAVRPTGKMRLTKKGMVAEVEPITRKALDLERAVTAEDVWRVLDDVRGEMGTIAKLDEAVPAIGQQAAVRDVNEFRVLVKEMLEGTVAEPSVFGSAGAAQAKYNRLIARWKDVDTELSKKFGAAIDAEITGGKRHLPMDAKKLQAFVGDIGGAGFEPQRRVLAEALGAIREIGDELAGDTVLQGRIASIAKDTEEFARLGRARADVAKIRGKASTIDRVLSAGVGGAVAGPGGAVVGGMQPFVLGTVMHLLDGLASRNTSRIGALAKSIATRGKRLRERAPVAALIALEASRFTDHTYSKKAKSKREAYARRVVELRQVAANPAAAEASLRRRVAPFASEAPTYADAMVKQGMRAAQYLITRLPPEPPKSVLSLGTVRSQPSDSDITQFAEAVRVVEDPISALDDLAHGRLSIEAARALRATAPKLFEEMKATVISAIVDAGKPVPYEIRLQLGLFFDEPLDPSMDPAFIASCQASFAPPSPTAAPGAKPLRSTKDLKSIQNAATSTQRLEASREIVT